MTKNLREYDSDDVLVTYDVKRCIHAAECVRGLPAVFDTDKRPWVQPENASADEVAEVVMRCPTGALHFERKDGGSSEPVPEKNTLQIEPNGPLYVKGDIEIVTQDDVVVLKDTRVALCRCGASKVKPFCDNSHKDIAFKDEGYVRENQLSQKDGDAVDGKLAVTPAKNGPLLIQGPLEIFNADDELACEGSKGALCRCGHSSNKPFCDGTHNQIGFEAD